MPRTLSRARSKAAALAAAGLVVLAACGSPPPEGPRGGPGSPRRSPTPIVRASGDLPPPPEAGDGPTLLASSFERPICGRYQHPGPGCEFGYEGDDLETGEFDCRTGASCLRVGRMSHSHMGVIREVPIPGGNGFVGLAQRVPEIPAGAIPEDRGYIEILQLSPTDGVSVDGYPVEVRLYPDRRLGLALFREKDEAITREPVPIDEWFTTVVQLTSSEVPAPQRLWVFDAGGVLVDYVEIDLVTDQRWPHAERTAQKVGGVTSTLVPMDTYADDWWISEEFLGPVRIDPSGSLRGS
ncbi:MAG: hypothetical protein WD770_11725 [Actinomycetota bacterium]